MMKDAYVITRKAVTLEVNIRTASRITTKATGQSKIVNKLLGGEKRVTLNRVPHVTEAEHGLISVSISCDDYHTLEVTNCKFFLRRRRSARLVMASARAECIKSI